MLLFCISIGAIPFSKLSCVSMCTFMHAHTYTPHTSTGIHLQLQSHVFCLCKFVFPCYGNLPITNRSLVATCTFRHMQQAHAHARTFMYTHRSHASNMCIYTHKHGFGSHSSPTCTHAHTYKHTQNWPLFVLNYYVISLLSLVVMSTFRCEPALQKCTHMHTGMHTHTHTHRQTHTLTQTNARTYISANLHPLLLTPFCMVHTLVPPPLEQAC